MTRPTISYLLFTASLLACARLHAADWIDTGTTDWNTGSNWSTGLVPNNDGAYISSAFGNIATISAYVTNIPLEIFINSGTLNHTAGSISVQNAGWPFGWVVVGGGNSSATYNIADTAATGGTFTGFGTGSGSLTAGSEIRVGAGVWWSGVTGLLNINTTGTVQAGGQLSVGTNNGDTGTVNIDAGTVSADSAWIGSGGATSAATGTLRMSGGTLTLTNRLTIGVGTDSSNGVNVGVVTLSGGTLTTDATHNDSWIAGVNMASGYNTATGGSATFNLDGGVLSTLRVFSETGDSGVKGTSIFNFNGGTLQGQANVDAPWFQFMGTDITRANVRNGGAVIDTNGYNLYIGQVLEHSNIGGDLAIDGGLTKNGAGTLILSNANTYSGGTTVNVGSIEVRNNTALGSGAVSIAAGASVLLNANSLTIANDFTLNGTTSGGALVSGDRPGGNVTTLSGTITLAADSNIASWWNDKTLALSGKITGSGSLTFDRATALGDPVGGKFLISGTTNDYTGSTTVNGKSGGNAILQLGAANALPTGTTLTLNDANLILNGFNQTLGGLVASTTTSQIVNGSATAVTLTVNNAADNTFAGVLGGGGTNENNFALTKDGTGTLSLSGANTYAGSTTISAGTLQFAKTNSMPSTSAVTASSGATLAINAGGSGEWTNGTSGAGTIGGLFAGTGGQGNTVTLNSGSVVGIDTTNAGGSLTYSGNITNAGVGLTKLGTGTLVLNGTNTYSGGTTVNVGSIEVRNNTALGSGAVSIAAGASVLLNANSLTIANDFTLNGTTSGGALVSGDRPGGNVTTLSGTITLAADSNIASWWNDKTLALSGKITGSGSLTFDRATALGDPVGGKFLISGATNDYAGSTTVNGRPGFGNAILQLGAANALPTGTTLTLNDANLILNGFNQTLGGLVASTTTSQIVNGSATAVTLTVNNAADNTFAGVLGGGGTNENNFALTKGGTGTLSLANANTFDGDVAINAGTVQVSKIDANGNAQPLGKATTAITLGSALTGTLEYTGTSAADLQRDITVGGSGGGVVKNSGGNTLTLSGTITKDGNNFTAQGGAFIISGKVTGTSANSDLNVDGATVTLTNTNNDYNGPTKVYGGGTLKSGATNVIPGVSTLILGEAATNSSGTYDLNGYDSSVAGLSSAGTGSKTVTNSAASGTSKLTVTGTSTFDGVIADGATAKTALTKSTGGNLTLTGSSTYTGDTTVDSGKITLASPGMITSNVTVASGASFADSGTLSGHSLTIQSGGNFYPGDASTAGIATFINGGLDLNTGSNTWLDLGGATRGTQYDAIDGLTSLALGGTLHIGYINGFTASIGQSFNLIDFSSLSSAIVNNGYTFDFTNAVPPTGDVWNTANFLSTGSISLIAAPAAPEPSRALLLAAGLAATALRRRRMR